ncbi:MAG: hypothetical protein LBV41_04030 [Cytophagaceae bacterium]|jgi:hypothetical protein|nr:hypothetical protein [Cytophagaceae bacterium]
MFYSGAQLFVLAGDADEQNFTLRRYFHEWGCKLSIECAWVYPNVELKAALLKITFEKAL